MATKTIDLNRLEIFKEVVLAGSFSKAALKLRQPKSRISRNISALETELGVQLIYRTTRQFQLTPSGQDLFRSASPLLNQIQDTLESVSSSADEIAGEITVTVPNDIGTTLMGKICAEFMALYPKIRINLHVGNEYVDLVKESVDVALRIGRGRDSTMIQKKVGSVGMMFVASPQFRGRYGSVTRLDQLEKFPFLGFQALQADKRPLKVTNGRETKSLRLNPIFASNNFFTLRDLAIEGTGFTQLPSFVAQRSIDEQKLVPLLPDWRMDGTPVHILVPQQRETPLRVRKFNIFLATSLAPHLALR